ncbi:uncharacterized protein F4822DRAFT_137105 [Hypoxylon trugodes]|uniref:uncharacterized protein n=1 Tax=Hypoxylon trugodes TaxID=326681 RepID=UPI00219B1690|nr:uncharacterized protein F4822DRAFT_137105 [Hypoxylon trugodes]KAI1392662.1 hypothetical protein F4822DRAFT_137105 [Hypoxylon trugodes]
MATNLKLGGDPQLDPPEFFGETHIRRHLVRIPRDQRKLLDRQESWAQFLNVGPKRFLNVPPEVLENLKNCHARQLQPTQSDKPSSPDDPKEESDNNEKEQDAVSFSSQVAHSEPDANSNDGDNSDAEETCSWAESPESHKRPPREIRTASSEDNGQQFLTQLQQPISSPRLTVPTPIQRKPLPPFPPSSQEQEETLDIEVPTAIGDKIPPLNTLAAQKSTTPTSAQIIPCTFQQSEQSSTLSKTKGKEQRIYKTPKFYRPGEKSSSLMHRKADSAKPDHSSTDSQGSTSTMNPSSSIIPSTIPIRTPGNGRLPVWRANPVISTSKESPINREDPSAPTSPPTRRSSPEYRPTSPRLRSSPLAPPIAQTTPSTVTLPLSASHEPFIRYCLTYINYEGSLRDFLKPCVYIQQQLQLQRWRIRTSLYDDFIRAWNEGYEQYVRDCDHSDPPVKALNAIEWYNNIDDDPLYTSRVITRQNLESTLEHYPEEVQLIQSTLGTPKIRGSETAISTPDAALLARSHRSTSQDNGTQNVKVKIEDSPITSPKMVGDGLRLMPKPAISTLHQESKKIIQLHKSMSEADQKLVTSKGLQRSLSEATYHKRKASKDLTNGASKRLSVNSLAGSDSGSNASMIEPPGSPFPSLYPISQKKKKRYDNDPLKRARDWEKFVIKRRQREMDGIASSAPVSNTPTSGQRE